MPHKLSPHWCKTLRERISRRLRYLLLRCVQLPRILFYRCVSTNQVKGHPRRYQPLQCVGRGEVRIDDGVSVGVFPSPFFPSTYAYLEARNSSAAVTIGTGTWLNNNFCAIAEHVSISIGKNCLIGMNVEISDSDFHGMAVENRRKSLAKWARPVLIQDDVFIGSNVKVLKGVTVGCGSIIANGSIVTKDIPAGVIAGGNPARVIKVIGADD